MALGGRREMFDGRLGDRKRCCSWWQRSEAAERFSRVEKAGWASGTAFSDGFAEIGPEAGDLACCFHDGR